MKRDGNEEIDPEFVARITSYLGFNKERVQWFEEYMRYMKLGEVLKIR